MHNEVGKYVQNINIKTKIHFDSLHNNGKLNQSLLNPVEDLKLLPFWIVAEILYGELSKELLQMLEKLIPLRESLFRRVIGGGITRFWWSRYLPIAALTDLVKFEAEWSQFNDLAQQHAARQSSQVHIVRLYEAMESGSMTKKHMLQTLDEILFANLDVTMGGISWALMFLGAHPDFQTELRAEIMKNTLKNSSKELEQNYVLAGSTLLAASILESSRLKPLAAFSIPQSAPTDRIVEGFIIPAGTNFIVDTYALNTHNAYWGDDNTAYRPSRFLERNAVRSRYNFWRFGFGPRTCMGKHIADVIIRVILVHILKGYELSLIDGEVSWVKNKATWITHPDTVLRCRKLDEHRPE